MPPGWAVPRLKLALLSKEVEKSTPDPVSYPGYLSAI